jgi:hypothetical protein
MQTHFEHLAMYFSAEWTNRNMPIAIHVSNNQYIVAENLSEPGNTRLRHSAQKMEKENKKEATDTPETTR